MNTSTNSWRALATPRLAIILLPAACLLWSFWPTFVELAQVWQHNPQHTPTAGSCRCSPAACCGCAATSWTSPPARRAGCWACRCWPWGIGLRLRGAYYFYVWLDPLSIVPTVAGLVCLLGGIAALRWSWPGVLFLGFMVPLPYRLATALSGPLQELATIVSTFLMQTIGLPALSEGNVIHLNEESIGVVEACSGLSMLMVFFALSTLVAVLSIRRPLVERLVVVASAVPIALVANILRITATGVLLETTSSATAKAFFHDLAGWLMMPVGLAFLWVELKILGSVVPASRRRRQNRATRPAPPPAASPFAGPRRRHGSSTPETVPVRARQTPPPARDKARAARKARVTGDCGAAGAGTDAARLPPGPDPAEPNRRPRNRPPSRAPAEPG